MREGLGETPDALFAEHSGPQPVTPASKRLLASMLGSAAPYRAPHQVARRFASQRMQGLGLL